MKYLLLVCVMILCLVPWGGWAEEETIPALYPIRENGLWGYMDRTGKVVIEPQWAKTEAFRGRYAVVYPDVQSQIMTFEYCGIIDITGDWVLQPDHRQIRSFNDRSEYIGGKDEGIYVVQDMDTDQRSGFFDIPSGFYSGQQYQRVDFEWGMDMDPELVCVTMHGKKGFAGRTNGQIMIPCEYAIDYHYYFCDGLCRIMPDQPEIADGWIVIDRQGHQVTLPEGCYAAGAPGNGLMPVWDRSTDLCGYADDTGSIVIAPQYGWAYDFHEGRACVRFQTGQFAVISPDGETVFILPDNPNTQASDTEYHHGYLCSGHYSKSYDLEYISFFDRDGSEAFRLAEDGLIRADPFQDNGVAVYMTGSKNGYGSVDNVRYGLFNTQGDILTPPVISEYDYEQGLSYREGLLPIRDAETGKYGYINEKAVWIIPPRYDRAAGFLDGLALVEKDGKLCYIGHDGRVVWQEDSTQETVPALIGDEAP